MLCMSSMGSTIRFKPARLVAGRVQPALELVDVLTAKVAPKNVGRLMQVVASELPLGRLQHLKRVRKRDAECEVLIGPLPAVAPAAAEDAFLQQLPPALAQLLQAISASLSSVQVPAIAAESRSQWEQWNGIWPMPWKVPTGVLEEEGEPVSAQEQQYFEHFMAMVLQHAAAQAPGRCNAALIVNPADKTIMGLGLPQVHAHPLAHAVMQAVDAVAAADREQWPDVAFEHSGRRSTSPEPNPVGDAAHGPPELQHSDHSTPPAAASAAQPPQQQQLAAAATASPADASAANPAQAGQSCSKAAGVHSPHHKHMLSNADSMDGAPGHASPKRQRLLDGSSQPQQQQQPPQISEASPVPPPAQGVTSGVTEAAPTPPGEAAPAAAPPPPQAAAQAPTAAAAAASKPYLCTGYDCFVLQEPCSMCAMALVHSRVARVIFCRPDASHGALGGLYRLQARRSLNHHYRVYHLPLEEEDLTAAQQPTA